MIQETFVKGKKSSNLDEIMLFLGRTVGLKFPQKWNFSSFTHTRVFINEFLSSVKHKTK